MLTLYTRRDCHLCTSAEQILRPLATRLGIPLTLADIDSPTTDPLLRAHYDTAVPVLHLNDREIARHRVEPLLVEQQVALSRTNVVVLSKFPTPGKVKTRLTVGQDALTPTQAAAVHRASLIHLLSRLTALAPNRLILCFDPPDAAPAFSTLLSPTPNLSPELLPQSPGDLGQRIASAHIQISASPTSPSSPTLYLGVDSPDLPDSHLLAAAHHLTLAPTTLGPTPDGGYWTIGLHPNLPIGDLLHGIPWSSGNEYRATLERFAQSGYPCRPSPEWDDVDHPADLNRLLGRLSQSTSPQDRALHTALQGAIGGNPS